MGKKKAKKKKDYFIGHCHWHTSRPCSSIFWRLLSLTDADLYLPRDPFPIFQHGRSLASCVRQQKMMGNCALPVPPGFCASRIWGPHAHKALTHVKPNFSIFLLETTLLKRREANLPVRASHCEGHMKLGRYRPAGCDSASCFQCLGRSAALAPSPAADLTSPDHKYQVNWWDGP